MRTRKLNAFSAKPCSGAGMLAKVIVLAGVAACLSSRAGWAEPKWGATTNGVRLGMATYTTDSFGKNCPPLCILYVQKVSSNFFYLVFPKPDRRYDVQMLGPDGRRIALKVGKKLSEHDKVVRRALRPSEVSQIDSFVVPDVFTLRTNGTYELVISAIVCTNLLLRETRPTFCYLRD